MDFLIVEIFKIIIITNANKIDAQKLRISIIKIAPPNKISVILALKKYLLIMTLEGE